MVRSLAPVRGSGRTSDHVRVDTRTGRVGSMGAVPSDKRPIGRSDLDTHADTCVAGATHKVLERTGQFCEVYPYSEDYEPKIVEVVNSITAFDAPDGQTYILLFNQALDIPGQEPSLICPNQLRDNGLIVNDCPKQYDNGSSHSIDVVNLDVELPLQMHGVLSYLPTRYPSHQDEDDGIWIEMTSTVPWDPASA